MGNLALWAGCSSPFAQTREKQPTIACLVTGSVATHGNYVRTFRRGLRDLGYVEGQTLQLTTLWSEGRLERLPALALDIAAMRPDIVVTATVAAALACSQTMPDTAIVSATLVDPVGLGVTKDLARPSRNITGYSLVSFDSLLAKQVQLAREVIGAVSTVGVLVNRQNPARQFQLNALEKAATGLNIATVAVEVSSPEEFGSAIERMATRGCNLLLVPTDALFITYRRLVIDTASRLRLPIVSGFREIAVDGGLLSYGTDIDENWRRAAYFVDRLLKGARPSELPIEQPTRYSLALNVRTAGALGITIGPALMALADELLD